MDQVVFTPAAVLDLLSQIDELKDLSVGVSETLDGGLQVTVGDSVYEIAASDAEDVEVPEEVVQDVDEINSEAYQNVEGSEPSGEIVEGGLIKEFFKTLAIGGMIRLTNKMLGKDKEKYLEKLLGKK